MKTAWASVTVEGLFSAPSASLAFVTTQLVSNLRVATQTAFSSSSVPAFSAPTEAPTEAQGLSPSPSALPALRLRDHITRGPCRGCERWLKRFRGLARRN